MKTDDKALLTSPQVVIRDVNVNVCKRVCNFAWTNVNSQINEIKNVLTYYPTDQKLRHITAVTANQHKTLLYFNQMI